MKNLISHLLKSALGLLLATLPSMASAQDGQKPAVVVSLGSIEQLMDDVGYLTRVAGSPEIGAIITIMSGQYIEGLDTKRPAGGYINFGPQPTGVVFLPITDFDAVVAKIEESVGELEDVGGGVKKLSLQREIFLKEHNGWIFATDQQDNLNNLPVDPQPLLESLHERYDIAIRANVQSIPTELRQMLLSEIKNGYERTVANETDEDKRQAQEEFGGRAIERIERFADEADQLTIGWGTNREQGKTYIDFTVTAVTKTRLAAEIDTATTMKSHFAGFLLPDVAARFHFTAPVLPEDVKQTSLILDTARDKALEQIDKDEKLPSDEARKEAKQIVSSLMEVLKKTIENGQLNGGAVLTLEPGNINFAAGGLVADGKTVESALKRLVKLAQQSDDASGIDVKFDVASHAGVAFHTIVVPVPEKEQEARKILGDKLVTVIGTGAKSVYFALGDDSMDLLKRVIDGSAASNEATSPMALNVALGPILDFAASVEGDPVVAGLAEALKNGKGKDRISILSRAIPRGVAYRVEVEEDVLQLIGKAAKMQNAGDRDPF